MMRFDTLVLERRRAAREEEAEGAGAISNEGALSEGREGVNCCFNQRLQISIHHPVTVSYVGPAAIEQSIYDIPDTLVTYIHAYVCNRHRGMGRLV